MRRIVFIIAMVLAGPASAGDDGLDALFPCTLTRNTSPDCTEANPDDPLTFSGIYDNRRPETDPNPGPQLDDSIFKGMPELDNEPYPAGMTRKSTEEKAQ